MLPGALARESATWRGRGTAAGTDSGNDAHLLRASSSDSNVFCSLSSSIRVIVTSFSRSLESAVAIGGVTPRNLTKPRIRTIPAHRAR
jgi:hypothetical protein